MERLGSRGAAVLGEVWAFLRLCSDAFWEGIVGPLRGRFAQLGSTTEQAVRFGVDAAPIVLLLSFLLGLILAFQAAYQLRQFGANIYVANLVGVAFVREFGPLMTAIVVAGRSGSAIAAELSTMTVNEEVDALRTMGLEPMRYLVVPRVYSLLLTQPALSIFSMAMGILGGITISLFYLGIGVGAYMEQTIDSLSIGDFTIGIGKSLVFSQIIAFIGCHCGLRVTGGAAGVGRATTASVVAAIFSVIVADSAITMATTTVA